MCLIIKQIIFGINIEIYTYMHDSTTESIDGNTLLFAVLLQSFENTIIWQYTC